MNLPLAGFIERLFQMLSVYEAFPCAGCWLRPLARLPNRRVCRLSAVPSTRYNLCAMQIQELGEFGVIDLLNRMVVGQRDVSAFRNRIPAFAGKTNGNGFPVELLVDTGDDTAAWRTSDCIELFTTDTVVEGVHFTRATTPWRDLGWKCIASNVSDIAAMGGLPAYALITLGLPPETEVGDLEELYHGMLEMANQCGAAIIGGDMVRSPVVFITVGLTGVHEGSPMLRANGRPGDLVGVTGYLGGSGGGLRLMLGDNDEQARLGRNPAASSGAVDYLRHQHRRPEPAVKEGRILADAGVRTAMDVSDGLADDLGKLCRASGLSARLNAELIPAHPYLKEAYPDDYLGLALHGGEDYLLLFTASTDVMDQVMLRLFEGAAVIGELLEGEPGRVSIVDETGSEVPAAKGGWDHYR